jgi:hypothetical protein
MQNMQKQYAKYYVKSENQKSISKICTPQFADDAYVPVTTWKSQKAMLHSGLKSPTISTLFQRPSEGVDKCDFRVPAGGGKKLMAFQTTKGVTATTDTP